VDAHSKSNHQHSYGKYIYVQWRVQADKIIVLLYSRDLIRLRCSHHQTINPHALHANLPSEILSNPMLHPHGNQCLSRSRWLASSTVHLPSNQFFLAWLGWPTLGILPHQYQPPDLRNGFDEHRPRRAHLCDPHPAALATADEQEKEARCCTYVPGRLDVSLISPIPQIKAS
jgi:hypothetical protein